LSEEGSSEGLNEWVKQDKRAVPFKRLAQRSNKANAARLTAMKPSA